jgi:hypothetical protein
MSEPARLAGVFFEPKKTFEDVARRPAFIVPLVLVILGALAYVTVISQRIGFDRVVRQQMEASGRLQQMPPEQRERAMEMGAKVGSIFAYVIAVIGTPAFYLAAAAILLLITSMMSAGLKYKQIFAIMCYSGLPGLIFMALTVVVIFLKNPDEFNIQNPLAFNPGAFLDPQQTSKFLYSVASSLDIFSFWQIALVAIGLKAAAGRKLSFGSALIAVVVPWAAVILIRAAFAGLQR